MKPLVYFKLQAKNLFKDYQTKKSHVDEALGITYFDYAPKFFDINRIFSEYDWDEENFSLMKAQHLFALMLGFEKWTDLAKASDEELELTKLLWDNQHKIGLDDWSSYIARAEADNGGAFETRERIVIFKHVYADVAGHYNPLGDYRLKNDISPITRGESSPKVPKSDPRPKIMTSKASRSFGEWLVRQSDRAGLVGDLAEDAKQDPDFPTTGDIDRVVSYLSGYGAHIRSALAEAILDWRNLQRGRVRKKEPIREPVHALTYRAPSGNYASTACRIGLPGKIARSLPLSENRSDVTCPKCTMILSQNGWEFSQSGMCASCDNYPHEGHQPDCVFVRVFGCSTAPKF